MQCNSNSFSSKIIITYIFIFNLVYIYILYTPITQRISNVNAQNFKDIL